MLFLLPFRNAALAVVQRLAALAQAETRTDSVQHKERFLREYGDEDGEAQVPVQRRQLSFDICFCYTSSILIQSFERVATTRRSCRCP